MCIEVRKTFTTRRDLVVYGVFRQQATIGLIGLFANTVPNVGLQQAEDLFGVVDTFSLYKKQIGFHRFGTVGRAGKYAMAYRTATIQQFCVSTSVRVVKSIIPKGTIVSVGKISPDCIGGGIAAILTPVIIQTHEVVG